MYLDMRASDDDTAPPWTLQYAVVQPPVDAASGGLAVRLAGVPTPPYATLKSNWTFQPAQIGRNAISLKILLGIRLNAR